MASNMFTSASAVQMRWLKLYRKIHNMFMKDEFVHITDYNFMVTQMNERITILEAKLNVELGAIATGLLSHVHPSPPAPVNPVVTAPPVLPPYTPQFTPTPLVVPVTTAMEAYDAVLQATGPGFAPMGDGSSVEAIVASQNAQFDLGT